MHIWYPPVYPDAWTAMHHPLKRTHTPSNIPPPSTSATTRTSNARATSLQLLQDFRRIRAVHIEGILIRRVPPSNFLDHVVWVRGANHWYL
jgi:hypothetical protein